MKSLDGFFINAAPFEIFAGGPPGSVLSAGGFTLPDLPSEQARATLDQLGVPPSVLAIVIQSTGSGRAGQPAFEAAAAAAVADVSRAAHVTGILDQGSEVAREVARETIAEVRQAVGLPPLRHDLPAR